MTWSTSASGAFHEVAAQLREANPTSDQIASRSGHIQLAKDAALTVVDSKRSPGVSFDVSLNGSSQSQDDFKVGISVTSKAVAQPTGDSGAMTSRGDQL